MKEHAPSLAVSLSENSANVGSDGRLGYVQLLAYLDVRPSSNNQVSDLGFAVRKRP